VRLAARRSARAADVATSLGFYHGVIILTYRGRIAVAAGARVSLGELLSSSQSVEPQSRRNKDRPMPVIDLPRAAAGLRGRRPRRAGRRIHGFLGTRVRTSPVIDWLSAIIG